MPWHWSCCEHYEQDASLTTQHQHPHTCPMHPEVPTDGPGSCPQSGMALESVGAPQRPESIEGTCPMHPEVVRAAPKSCLICGMALDRRHVSGEREDESPELRDTTRRFWLAAAFTVPLFVVSMGDLLPGEPISRLLSPRARTLIELGVSVAYGQSVVAALAPPTVPRFVSITRRTGCRVLLCGRRDRRIDLVGPGSGASCMQPNGRGDQRASRSGGQDRASHP